MGSPLTPRIHRAFLGCLDMAREEAGGETSNPNHTSPSTKLARPSHNSVITRLRTTGVNLPEAKGHRNLRNAEDESDKKHQGRTK